jgi:hypothetical protein
MTNKPILFSAPMIRALLDGRKTQTRRVLKPQPQYVGGKIPGAIYKDDFYWPLKTLGCGVISCNPFPPARYLEDYPIKHAPGDRLWVREAWSGEYVFRNMKPAQRPKAIDCGHGDARFRETVWHWADGSPDFGDWEKPRPSIHMPRWASRLTLVVTDVRVQRVQEINQNDCIAEGIFYASPDVNGRHEFEDLWDSITAKQGFGWDANPWVVALTFDVHKCNIDQMEEDH